MTWASLSKITIWLRTWAKNQRQSSQTQTKQMLLTVTNVVDTIVQMGAAKGPVQVVLQGGQGESLWGKMPTMSSSIWRFCRRSWHIKNRSNWLRYRLTLRNCSKSARAIMYRSSNGMTGFAITLKSLLIVSLRTRKTDLVTWQREARQSYSNALKRKKNSGRAWFQIRKFLLKDEPIPTVLLCAWEIEYTIRFQNMP